MDYPTARIHNLLLRVYRAVTDEDSTIEANTKFTKEYLKGMYFRESDFRLIDSKNPYFKHIGEHFILTDQAKTKVTQYSELHNEYKNQDCKESEYIEVFEEAHKLVLKNFERNKEEFNKLIAQITPLAPPLHWKHQPEHEEYLLINSNLIPENDLTVFYDNYHMLEDMYWILTDNPKKKNIKSFLGDGNLNAKFDFNVYSRRWGHPDRYRVSRSLDGWDVEFLSTGGKGDKEGNAIIHCLKHDSINYPCSIGDYFEEIWNYADSNEVNIKRIEDLMSQIAKWISTTEEATPEFDFSSE